MGDVHLHTTYAVADGAIRFHTRTGADKATNNERLTIAGDGNIGIGTASPDEILHVKGDGARIYVDSADYNLFSIGRRASSGADLDKVPTNEECAQMQL